MFARRMFAVVFLFALLSVLALARPAGAAPQPADEALINERIKWGAEYLKKEQKASGAFGAEIKEGNGVGYTSLAGLTLVECGVPTTDPGLRRAANAVRNAAGDIESTYELALAILFLDRMKDKSDKTIIQFLAARLIAGQMPSGGWGYKNPKLNTVEAAAVIAALKKITPPPPPKDGSAAPPFDFDKARKSALTGLPVGLKRIAVMLDLDQQLPADAKDKRQDPYDATTDNSNTHFAMLGLWAARSNHDVPTDRVFARVNRRFRTTQGAGGTWGYDYVRGGADGGNQFACIALLALAIGHVVSPDPDVKPEADPIIINAFVPLSKAVGEPVGDIKDRPKIKDVGGLYFLWAMERIAVLYDLKKLGKKDWYLWGAEILICNQNPDGHWTEGGYPGETKLVNTCFALLFLRRANLTPDLSKKLPVNPKELTAKVEDKITPKIEPPPPPPTVVEPPPSPKVEPPPPPKTEPKKEPPPPPAPVVQPQPSPTPEPAPAPAKKSTPWLWIVLGTVFAGVLGGGLAFFLVAKRGKKDEDEGNGEKKKKKGKKKAKAEDGEKESKEEEKPTKKKAKAEANGDDEKPTKKKAKAEAAEEEDEEA